MTNIFKQLQNSFVALALFTVLLGGLYPLVTTGILQTVFPFQAQGSLIHDKTGQLIGSSLIGQAFSKPEYLWGRLSATATAPYNAGASSGSNLGLNNPALLDQAKGRLNALKEADPTQSAPVPVDLVTASASGLDPEISPAAAAYQVPRIARARGVSEKAVRDAISRSTSGRTFGVFGEPRVNVLKVNLRLDGKLS